MNQETSDDHPIATNFWFVFFAYFIAIATWSILAGHDFLSSKWQTVEPTRKRGQLHLVVVTLPMLYMAVYIYYQFQARDYTEVSAALVALGFAILHMLRTIMGLWQLHVFKQWVITSIICMESLGYKTRRASRGKGYDKAEEGVQDEHERKKRLNQQADNIKAEEGIKDAQQRKSRLNQQADNIKVNETIVENSLLGGEVRCDVRIFNKKQRKHIESAGNRLKQAILTCMHTVITMMCIVGLESNAFSTPKHAPHLDPREPEELYLLWSLVLVSACFPEWLADMKTTKVAEKEQDYETRQNRFAMQVLRSAAVHTGVLCERMRINTISQERIENDNPPTNQGQQMPIHSLLPYAQWLNFPKLCSGKFCKEEFLAYACRTGEGLPFGAPHRPPEAQDGENISYNYSRFESKLSRARDSLPADESEKVADFDIEALEWLAVCLCVSDREVIPSMNIGENAEEFSMLSSKTVLEGGAEKSESANFDSKRVLRTDTAVQNLVNQLGLDLDSKHFLARFSNPFLSGAADFVLWGNRNVLELSLHVDNWLAICGGEQMAYMANNIPDMQTDSLMSKSGNTIEECARLEKQRFMFQISILNPEHSYLDQSLSFLGVSMENVRSGLAMWVETNGQTACDTWNQNIKAGGRHEAEIENRRAIEFDATADFKSLLSGISSEELLSTRFVKMRLLWELQNKLQIVLHENESCPNHTAAQLLCVLSFPTLCFDIKRTESSSHIDGTKSERSGLWCVTIEDEKVEFDFVDYTVTVKAALGPQAVHVDISFSRLSSEGGIAFKTRLCSGESAGEVMFDWELWRDAFHGSLEGMKVGREQHGFESLRVTRTNRGIAAGTCDVDTSNSGTGRNMKTWPGWLPWNPAVCKYELMSDCFILQRKTFDVTKSTAVKREGFLLQTTFRDQKYEAVQYDTASAGALQHASMVAYDFLQRASESTIFPLEGWNDSFTEDICSRADTLLLSGKKSDTNAALVLYEIAASELGRVDALRKAVGILVAEEESVETEERVFLGRKPVQSIPRQ